MSVLLDTILGGAYQSQHSKDLQDQHQLLCKYYKNATSPF
jgi:hypothetical protein